MSIVKFVKGFLRGNSMIGKTDLYATVR